jgi:hypothetical protein
MNTDKDGKIKFDDLRRLQNSSRLKEKEIAKDLETGATRVSR